MITDYEDDTPQAAPPLSQRLNLNLTLLTEPELITLRDEIQRLLPTMADLDLNQELVLQFQIAKDIMARSQNDPLIPTNQKAQVLNSAAALLKQLSDAQVKLYASERLRAMEAALIDTLKSTDASLYARFEAEYSQRLELLI